MPLLRMTRVGRLAGPAVTFGRRLSLSVKAGVYANARWYVHRVPAVRARAVGVSLGRLFVVVSAAW